MFLQRTTLKCLGLFWLIVLSMSAVSQQQVVPVTKQDEKENDRAIIADDFLQKRPGRLGRKRSPTYRLTKAGTKRADQAKLQVGVTIWRFEPPTARTYNGERSVAGSYSNRADWVPKRVEANVKFREGDTLRISIESPRDGYLYVVNRDLLADGTYGETNLIFPTQDEDNRLKAGKVIDIPAQDEPPFKATPKPHQSSELLTIIVTSSPLPLVLSNRAIPISKTQLTAWEERWGAEPDRFEMNGGAGQGRTKEEQLAASPTNSRQLTREDPLPQTIYSLVPKNSDAFLFNMVLSYIR